MLTCFRTLEHSSSSISLIFSILRFYRICPGRDLRPSSHHFHTNRITIVSVHKRSNFDENNLLLNVRNMIDTETLEDGRCLMYTAVKDREALTWLFVATLART